MNTEYANRLMQLSEHLPHAVQLPSNLTVKPFLSKVKTLTNVLEINKRLSKIKPIKENLFHNSAHINLFGLDNINECIKVLTKHTNTVDGDLTKLVDIDSIVTPIYITGPSLDVSAASKDEGNIDIDIKKEMHLHMQLERKGPELWITVYYSLIGQPSKIMPMYVFTMTGNESIVNRTDEIYGKDYHKAQEIPVGIEAVITVEVYTYLAMLSKLVVVKLKTPGKVELRKVPPKYYNKYNTYGLLPIFMDDINYIIKKEIHIKPSALVKLFNNMVRDRETFSTNAFVKYFEDRPMVEVTPQLFNNMPYAEMSVFSTSCLQPGLQGHILNYKDGVLSLYVYGNASMYHICDIKTSAIVNQVNIDTGHSFRIKNYTLTEAANRIFNGQHVEPLKQTVYHMVGNFLALLIDYGNMVIDNNTFDVSNVDHYELANIPMTREDDSVHVIKLNYPRKYGRIMWQGGTHASPREHTRRGHWRRYKSGKTIWIEDNVINAGTTGKVEKVYEI